MVGDHDARDGDVVQFAVASTFPNHYVDMSITPDKAPLVLINKRGIEVEATGEVNMYARKVAGRSNRGVKASVPTSR